MAFGAGCRSRPSEGAFHILSEGETVYRLSQIYRVPATDIIEANAIDDVNDLQPGTRLWIPGAREPDLDELPRTQLPQSERRMRAQGDALAYGGLTFAWPLHGRLSSPYGRRGGRPHRGIDIAAPRGTVVRAAEAGRVLFAGRMGQYGNVVILRHSDTYETVYAHNRKNRVKTGEFVDKGKGVGEVGTTGNATGPHLHFEIRRDDRAEDPLLFLP